MPELRGLLFETTKGKVQAGRDDNWTPDKFGEYLSQWSQKTVAPLKIKTLSLFTGAGGLDIGFHDAGFEIVEMVEIEQRYCATLRRNALPDGYFGSGKVSCIDIRDYTAEIPTESRNAIDLIIGGPPCQTFSAAGRRVAGVSGTREDRGTLFTEYVRLLKAIQPRVFVFENVYGITGAGAGKDWKEIRAAFEGAGYKLYLRILDTADYGVPQHRERMFLVGLKSGDFKFPRPIHGPDSFDECPYFTPQQAISSIKLSPADIEVLQVDGRYSDLLTQIPPGLNYSFFTEKLGHPRPLFAWRSKFSDFLYKADPGIPVRTIKAQCGKYTGPFHWESRRFSIAELKRLQTFPDTYCLEGTRSAALQQIGNSVPPQIARILALSILENVFQIEPPIELTYMAEDEPLGFRKRKRQLSIHYKDTARKAIARSRILAKTLVAHNEERKFGLSKCYDLLIDVAESDHTIRFKFTPGEPLEIRVTDDRRRSRPAFTISVAPTLGISWIIPAPSIMMTGTRLTPKQFTLLWKGLSFWLRTHGLRDDLVQLAGYYAYEPSIHCKLTLNEASEWKWNKIEDVVSGIAVRKTLSKSELAEHLQLPIQHIPQFIKFLRSLGYEVRSEKTNPLLKEDSFLIPYCFPTLTRESVQRHKNPLSHT